VSGDLGAVWNPAEGVEVEGQKWKVESKNCKQGGLPGRRDGWKNAAVPMGTSFARGRRMHSLSSAAIRILLVVVFLLTGAAATVAGQEVPAPEAWNALKGGDAAKAAGLFREALERSPRNPYLHYGAGAAAYALGRNDASIAALKRALEYEPAFVEAAVLLATVAYANSELDLAVRTLEKAARLAPHDGRIRQQLERWKKESALHSTMNERTNVRFRVMFEGVEQQALGDRVSRVLESSYWSIGKTLNSYPGETLQVVLYTNKQFQDITRAPAWAGGGYDGRIRLPVGGALKTPAALDRVVRHELVHAMIAHAAPRNVPMWVNEGLASVLEGTDRTWVRRVLARTAEVFPLEDLASGFGELNGEDALVAYAESAVAAEILVERLGPNLGVFLQMLGNGHTTDQALGTLNVRPESFYAEWRKRIGVR
jgi:tetratricopeptide (TPR) repeat protein